MKTEKSPRLSAFPDAAGLSAVRAGFCDSPTGDALFALGWPHMRFLVDGHREDADPPGSALKILAMTDPPARFEWPRRVATGLVRAWGLPSIFELAPGVQDIRLEAKEAVWRPEPITIGEASDLLALRMGQDIPGVSEKGIEAFVLLLEALLGPEAVGGAILDVLEQMSPELLLAEWSLPPLVTWHLGFFRLRVRAAVASAWKARMEATLERAYELRPTFKKRGFRGAGSSHARSLALILGGGAAAESGSDRSLRWYAHVLDDSVTVRMRVSVNRLSYEPDARLVYLGGPDVLGRFARDWTNFGGSEPQRWFFEQIAPIAAPEMYPLMLDLSGRSLVRVAARDWFVARAPATRAWLTEVAAGDGTSATYAKNVLRAIKEAGA